MTFTELAATGVSIDIVIAGDLIIFHFQWKNQHYKHGLPMDLLKEIKDFPQFEKDLIGVTLQAFAGMVGATK